VPIQSIYAVLQGKTDVAGGFKWRHATGINATSALSVGGAKNAAGSGSGSGGGGGERGGVEGVGEEEDEEEEEKNKEDSWKLKLPKESKEYRSGGTLRDYQIEGLTWLLRCWYTKRSSILADEMGTYCTH
jgi:hypothetical protein